MLRKFSCKRSKDCQDVGFTDPILYLDAVAANVKVVCNWYRRDSKARGYLGATLSLTMMQRILESIRLRLHLGWWLSRCQGGIVTT